MAMAVAKYTYHCRIVLSQRYKLEHLTALNLGSLLLLGPLSSSMARGLTNFLLMDAATAGDTAPVAVILAAAPGCTMVTRNCISLFTIFCWLACLLRRMATCRKKEGNVPLSSSESMYRKALLH